jgi:hypothetical protein
MGITLDARMKNIPGIGKPNPDSWYRFHGSSGLDDFNKTGLIRTGQNSKYDTTYFSKGSPESRYRAKGGGSLIEAYDNSKIKPTTKTYGTVENLKAGKDRFRVFEEYIDPEDAIKKYRPGYDNYSLHKYIPRKLMYEATTPIGLGLEALFYSPNVGEGSDIINNNGSSEIDKLIEEIRKRRENNGY